MTFTESKQTLLRGQKEKWLSTFLYALLAATLLFLPYIIMDGGYFVFYGDYNVQQIPFYKLCHAMIREGNIAWNALTDLGTDFVSSYSFYLLGSPFFWLTLLFPNNLVPFLIAPLLILKFALSALTSYFYIRRFTRRAESARLGALLYAFSGFSVYNIFYNHFHEAIVFFPLLLLGLELLITENRRGFFALSVFISALSNYFFFFGMVVFTVIYLIVRMASKAVRVPFSRFVVIVIESVLGLLMASVLLLPSIVAIIQNTRLSEVLLGWNAIMYGKEQIYLNVIECFFFPPDIPARPVFFPGADVKWSSLGGWLPVFSMVGVFALFKNKKGNWLKKMIGILAFMALVPVLNSAFYAFNSAYYARWFYMPVLMMSLATAMMCEDRSVNWSGAYKWVLGITIAMAAVIGFFPQKQEDGSIRLGLYTFDESGVYTMRFFIAVIIAVVSLIILRLLIGVMKQNPKAFYNAATVCVIIIAVIYGNVYILSGRSHSYEIKEVVIEDLIEGSVELPKDLEYRIDTYDGVDNTAMFLGYSSINAFHSVVPQSICDFYDFVGEERVVASRPTSDNYALRSLLSVKYLLNRADGESFVNDEGETIMPDYEYIKTENDYYIYENKNFIPYGFSYDYYMSYDFCESYSESSRAALMLKAILLTDEQIEKYGKYMTNIEDIDDKELDFYDETADDETVLDDEALLEEETDMLENISLLISEETYIEDCARLKKTAADRFEYTKNGFVADISMDKTGLVFFSVPFKDGWTATVNGKEANIERVNEGFMAVEAVEGVNLIEFKYKTPFLDEGILISGGAVVVFLVYFLFAYFYAKNNPHKNGYPEGEELLTRWQIEEAQLANDSETEEEPISILDDTPIVIPKINEGFDGGFTIDLSEFEEDKGKD